MKNLAKALETQDNDENKPAQVVAPKAKESKPPAKKTAAKGREGEVTISAWFPHNVKFELEELRLELSRKAGRKVKMNELLAEAYNDLFKKYGRPELAPKAPR